MKKIIAEVLLVTMLIGCGGGGDSSDSSTPPAPTPPPVTDPTPIDDDDNQSAPTTPVGSVQGAAVSKVIGTDELESADGSVTLQVFNADTTLSIQLQYR